jgi:hypothetical protein
MAKGFYGGVGRRKLQLPQRLLPSRMPCVRTTALAALLATTLSCSAHPHPALPIAAPQAVPFGALPTANAANTFEFAGAHVCDRCHSAGIAAAQRTMRDQRGNDVSPIGEWQTSMMALSARDPYFLAALERERLAFPQRADAIADFCLKCHAPIGVAASNLDSKRLDFASVLYDTSVTSSLAREGVTCVACHAVLASSVGTATSYNANLQFRTDRAVFGRQQEPQATAMKQMINMSVEHGDHLGESRLCGNCHTVRVPTMSGAEILEQATYLEWQASAFSTESGSATGRSCQSCHMPTTSDQGEVLASALSTRPIDSPVRQPYSRHTLAGGSAYLLKQLASFTAWLGVKISPEQLLTSASRSEQLLASAARLQLRRDGADLAIDIINQTGHKLPTGYPSRRMWLAVVITDQSGTTIFSSGQHHDGKIIGVDDIAHKTSVTPDVARLLSNSTPLIFEAVPVDAAGAVTHLQTAVARFGKDNRIIPKGWTSDNAELAPIGMAQTIRDGAAQVRLTLPLQAFRIQAQLLFQAVPPSTIDSYDATTAPLASRFRAITAAPPLPTVMASVAIDVASLPAR